MKKCIKCNKRLWPWDIWRKDKRYCFTCGYCMTTEIIVERYGEDARKEIYEMEKRYRKHLIEHPRR